MTEIDQLIKEFKDGRDFILRRIEEGEAASKEEMERIAKGLLDAQEVVSQMRRDKLARIDDGRLRVLSGRLAGFDLFDLDILEKVFRDRQRNSGHGAKILETIVQSRADLREYMTPEAFLRWEDGAFRMRKESVSGAAGIRGLQGFKQALGSWREAMVAQSIKAMDSTTAGSGDELVPTLSAAQLWLDVNLETLILPLIPQITMPSNPFDMPAQLGDTNWYPTSENVQVTTTDLSTAKVTLTAQGLRTGVPFSDELEEDAVIALVPEIRSSLVRNGAEVIDDVLLNADQTALNGINSDGTTITKADAGKAQWLLGFDGIIHLALVDNSSNQSADFLGANMTANGANAALTLLGKYAVPKRRGDVVFIADVNTAVRMLSITEVETLDVAGVRATLSTGELFNLYGKPFIQSEQMRLADADGKITDTGNSTDTGRLLVFNTTQWRVGFRRQMTVETDREPGKGQTTMYVSFRIALAQRAASRGTATHTALSFNIAIT